MEALDLATTDQLIDALARRFETFACVAMKEAISKDLPNSHAMMWRYKGNRFMCVGMSFNLINLLNGEIEQEIDVTPPGDL